MSYCIYLRKSRKDLESESQNTEDTLLRHEQSLVAFAKQQGLFIERIYREIVSGETIQSRPVMQHLLSEVQAGLWEGVLVMEIERLARGDTIDQGLIARSFRYSNTKIITPLKTYHPDNPFDQEYFEFHLFMSRREYLSINRRMQAGRAASVLEGKFASNVPPYGYRREKLLHQKGFQLVPDPCEAPAIPLIFTAYAKEGASLAEICHLLTAQGFSPRRSKRFSCASVRDILKNPVYIGKLRWNYRKTMAVFEQGDVKKIRPRQPNYLIADGLHEPLIESSLFESAQKRMLERKNSPTWK